MEFTYKVSEEDYWRAWRLRLKPPRTRVLRTVVFWAFILICLLVLWRVVELNAPITAGAGEPATTQQPEAPTQGSGTTAHSLLVNVGPFIVLIGFWALMLRFGQWAPRRIYRKDPLMQGQYTVTITPESISTQNTAGTSTKRTWNIFASWREGKDVIVLIYYTGAYFILSVGGLSEGMRSELRGILTAAVPKK